MPSRNLYSVLGVTKNASQRELKQAFRKLAHEYHPDVNGGNAGSEKKFKQINEAYEILSNVDSRKAYDAYGDNWKHARSNRSGRSTTSGVGFDNYSNIFGSVFGGIGGQPMPRRGRDREHRVKVTLEEAFSGSTRLLTLMEKPSGSRRLEVKIPTGVKTGSKVRIAGEGSPGASGGANGDLILFVEVTPHNSYNRKGDDLFIEVVISLTDAILGCETEFKTLAGNVVLKIPPETQNGKSFRLRGKGMPHLRRSGTGDLYAEINVQLPTELSNREREIFDELRELRS